MANSELYNKTFQIPNNVLNGIQAALVRFPDGDGIKRAKTLLNNKVITYQNLKRLKNYFDYTNPNDNIQQYQLAGGDLMKSFVDSTLQNNRDAVERGKRITRDIHANPNSELRTVHNQRINESNDNTSKNSTIIIVNKNNKILLLKRADVPEIWMPDKWALVGGGVENRETPLKAVKREVIEETGLDIDNIFKSFTIEKNGVFEYIYVCKYEGEDIDVKLNFEHTKYGWFSINEIEFLDTVPLLAEYLKLTFKSYE